jgi:hypothetical protein
MSGILVVFKRIRPSKSVNFYTLAGSFLTNAIQAEQSYTLISSENLSKDELTLIRSVYFPTASDYALWQGASVIQDIASDRAQYHQTHGITELKEVIHLNTI